MSGEYADAMTPPPFSTHSSFQGGFHHVPLTCCPDTPIRALLISRPFTKGLLPGSTGIT